MKSPWIIFVAAGIILWDAVWSSPVSAQDVPTQTAEEMPLPPQAVQFLRGIAVMLLPERISDEDDWGREKRIQSGLDVDFDGLRIDTKRRWKNVNHGTWQRVDATLVNPKEHFQLGLAILPRKSEESPRYRLNVSLRLRAVGRQQHWNYGVRLYSVSADATIDADIAADVEFRNEFVETDEGRKLQVIPFVETASLKLRSFRLHRVSHAKGSAIRELGEAMEPIVERAVRRKSKKLAAKINGKVQKKPERFRIPGSILAFLQRKEAADN